MRLFSIIFIALLLSPDPRAAGDGVVVVVSAGLSLDTIGADDLGAYYLKKKKNWPDGTAVRFVDRASGTPERGSFFRKVLKQSESEVDQFWIGQKLYTGDSAPLQVMSDSMVIQFVSAFPGAIGYVSPSTVLRDKRVRAVKVTYPGEVD